MSKLANKWRIRLNTNELKKLLKKYPDKPWDWEQISRNRGFELDMLTPKCEGFNRSIAIGSHYAKTKNPADLVDPNYETVSMNPHITWRYVLDRIDEAWCWETLSMNPAITFEVIRDNQRVGNKVIPWSWKHASENPNITPEIIRANREIDGMAIPWDYATLSENTSTTWEFVMSTLCPNCQVFHDGWDWHELSCNVATNEAVTMYPDAPWSLCGLAANNKIDLDTFAKCFAALPIEEFIDWERVSRHKVKSVDDIEKYDLPWDWNGLSRNNHITLRDMLDHPEHPWEWQSASMNINISIEDIKGGHLFNGEPIPWNWEWFSTNSSLTADIIEANPDENWDWSGFSCNFFNTSRGVRDRLERLAAEEDVRIPLFLAECCAVLPPVLAHLVMEYDVGIC
jgi:hypothetical protein